MSKINSDIAREILKHTNYQTLLESVKTPMFDEAGLQEAKVYANKLKKGEAAGNDFWAILGMAQYASQIPENGNHNFDFIKFCNYFSKFRNKKEVARKFVEYYGDYHNDFEIKLFNRIFRDEQKIYANIAIAEITDIEKYSQFIEKIANLKLDNSNSIINKLAAHIQIKRAIANDNAEKIKEIISSGAPLNFTVLDLYALEIGKPAMRNILKNAHNFCFDVNFIQEKINSNSSDLSYLVKAKTKEGTTVITTLLFQYSNDKFALFEKLLEKGAELNFQDQNYESLLHKALELYFQNPSLKPVLMKILGLKVDVNAQNNNGNTALHLIRFDDEEVINAFINHPNISVNIQNNLGNTPLMAAIVNGNLKLAVKLVTMSPNINVCIRNNEGLNAFDLANARGLGKIAELIKERKIQDKKDYENYRSLVSKQINNQLQTGL